MNPDHDGERVISLGLGFLLGFLVGAVYFYFAISTSLGN